MSASSRDERRVELERQLCQHNNELLNYISSWVRSRSDAKDIVQETYCRIFRLGDKHVVSHLRGYLYRTAKNIAIDWLRDRIVQETFAEQQPLRAAAEAPSPEHIWQAKEDLAELKRAVERLPPKCKMALLMVRVDGLSYQEVGQHLGIKTHSARRLVERAMEYLGTALPERNRKSSRKRRALTVD